MHGNGRDFESLGTGRIVHDTIKVPSVREIVCVARRLIDRSMFIQQLRGYLCSMLSLCSIEGCLGKCDGMEKFQRLSDKLDTSNSEILSKWCSERWCVATRRLIASLSKKYQTSPHKGIDENHSEQIGNGKKQN